MSSIWTQQTTLPQYPPLPGDLRADAVVIGGGMAGILTAYFLQKNGLDTIVLEAERIGRGQTENTTAKITAQHNLCYARLLDKFGAEKAYQYAAANLQAIEEYRRLVSELDISCDLEEKSAFLYTLSDQDSLQRELDAAQKLNIPAALTRETELPFPVASALEFPRQAQFQPLAFLKAVAQTLTIYEQTRALDVVDNQVMTDRGVVSAKHIIAATHYPFLNTPGYYFMRIHQERSYVLALKNAGQVNGMYLGIDPEGYSLRNSGELLLLGGGSHRTGENSAGGRYGALRAFAKQIYPDCEEVAHWSAQDCMTLDSVPYIGRYGESTSNFYVATGFHKWGMTNSMVSAMLLSHAVTGKDHPWAGVFSPQRFVFSASAKTLAEDGLQAVKGLQRRLLFLPDDALEDLPAGHGGIIEYQGEKAGVYRDGEGRLFAVVPKCPHLGCQLEWNPDETSWDCPCHGSRFDYRGNLLDNPAQKGLELPERQ